MKSLPGICSAWLTGILLGLLGHWLPNALSPADPAEPSAASQKFSAERNAPGLTKEDIHRLTSLVTGEPLPISVRREIIRALAIHPGLINDLHASLQEGGRDTEFILGSLFGEMSRDCPGVLLQVLQRVRFDPSEAMDGLIDEMQQLARSYPEEVLALNPDGPGSWGEQAWQRLRSGALTTPRGVAWMIQRYEAGLPVDEKTTRSTARTAILMGLSLPPSLLRHPEIALAAREREATATAREWLQGRLTGSPPELSDTEWSGIVEGLLEERTRLPTDLFSRLAETPEILRVMVDHLADRKRLEEILPLVRHLPADSPLAEDAATQALNRAASTDPFAQLGLSQFIADPAARAEAQRKALLHLIALDPDLALTALPQVTDPALRRELSLKADAARVSP